MQLPVWAARLEPKTLTNNSPEEYAELGRMAWAMMIAAIEEGVAPQIYHWNSVWLEMNEKLRI